MRAVCCRFTAESGPEARSLRALRMFQMQRNHNETLPAEMATASQASKMADIGDLGGCVFPYPHHLPPPTWSCYDDHVH
jgi:hypothetical protein